MGTMILFQGIGNMPNSKQTLICLYVCESKRETQTERDDTQATRDREMRVSNLNTTCITSPQWHNGLLHFLTK